MIPARWEGAGAGLSWITMTRQRKENIHTYANYCTVRLTRSDTHIQAYTHISRKIIQIHGKIHSDLYEFRVLFTQTHLSFFPPKNIFMWFGNIMAVIRLTKSDGIEALLLFGIGESFYGLD